MGDDGEEQDAAPLVAKGEHVTNQCFMFEVDPEEVRHVFTPSHLAAHAATTFTQAAHKLILMLRARHLDARAQHLRNSQDTAGSGCALKTISMTN